jgi:hypothetical protein
MFRLRRALDMGVNVGIGTDGVNCSDNSNMYEAMRYASMLSKVQTPDPSRWASVEEVYNAATVGSARALGFKGRPWTPDNIGGALAGRAVSAEMRERGMQTGGPAPLTAAAQRARGAVRASARPWRRRAVPQWIPRPPRTAPGPRRSPEGPRGGGDHPRQRRGGTNPPGKASIACIAP